MKSARHSALLSLAALVLLSSAGCVTSTFSMTDPDPGQVSSEGNPIRKVLHGMNTGVYLFYWIPLWSGSPSRPNRREYDLFMHQVEWKAMRRMFDQANGKLRGDAVEDFTCRESSSGVFGLWIFWKRVVRAQAVSVVWNKNAKNARTAADDRKTAEAVPEPEKNLQKSAVGDKL